MQAYPLLFDQVFTRIDPEKAHELAFRGIRTARPGLVRMPRPGRPVEAMGLTFPNVLGLAAGFDKNAIGIDALGGLGFGHIEIGTVTGEAQAGNPRPRLFRLVNDRAVVNRMGFNNDGAVAVANRLRQRHLAVTRAERHGWHPDRGPRTVLGVNIGKTKVVPEDDQDAVEADYGKSTRLLAPYADYLTVNVSSPNTPGLRTLQSVERLEPLLRHVRITADRATDRRVPLLVKIAPDLADEDVLAVGDLALALGLDGVIASNTTISREGLRSHPDLVAAHGAGGLSGRPLASRAEEVIRLLRSRVGPSLTLIGVGGISTVEDARRRLDAGADLLQGYTAFIYEGPWWARRLVNGVQG
ncbi:quinone-dependent dihydroorotate dehydrogenase [Nocardioides insulae]|uniref:quinone-dependent dihydroorotate dehydrogenase n=1 Tax=Nocardioides insulae TaxID=394734 RepID=UPI00041971F4|nr:quinone-dependent dihydroorotate dehydrogenase [Nocardioides insulae]